MTLPIDDRLNYILKSLNTKIEKRASIYDTVKSERLKLLAELKTTKEKANKTISELENEIELLESTLKLRDEAIERDRKNIEQKRKEKNLSVEQISASREQVLYLRSEKDLFQTKVESLSKNMALLEEKSISRGSSLEENVKMYKKYLGIEITNMKEGGLKIDFHTGKQREVAYVIINFNMKEPIVDISPRIDGLEKYNYYLQNEENFFKFIREIRSDLLKAKGFLV